MELEPILWSGVGLAGLAFTIYFIAQVAKGQVQNGGGNGAVPAPIPLPSVPTSASAAQPIGPLTASMVASAIKWAGVYGVPASWVVATAIVESNGNPNAVGDQGRSLGLMQINYGANASLLTTLGVQPGQLYDPDTNIHVGTAILRSAYDSVSSWLGGRTPPQPIDVLTRLAYRGPALVKNALAAGTDPVAAFDSAGYGGTASAASWRTALSQASAVV